MKSLVRRTKDGRSTNVTKVGDTDVTSHLLTKPNTVGGQSGKHLPDGVISKIGRTRRLKKEALT